MVKHKHKHRVYIDQSGKIENTEKPTVVAYSNDRKRSVMVSSSEKRKIQELFRKMSKPNIFVYKTFAVLIFLLIRSDLKYVEEIVVDREYKGRESLIKKYLIELFRISGETVDTNAVYFDEIGKQNNAHNKAISTFRQQIKPDIYLSFEDLKKWLI